MLLLSGFLAVIVLLRHAIEDNGGRLVPSDAVAFVLHRAFRLLPLYATVLAAYIFVVPLIGSGPFWYLFNEGQPSNCRHRWWTNLLFVNNLVPFDDNWQEGCMPWSYFIALDMQLCLLVPLAVVLYLQYAYAAIVSVIVLLAISVAAGAQSFVAHHLNPLLNTALVSDPKFLVGFLRALCAALDYQQ